MTLGRLISGHLADTDCAMNVDAIIVLAQQAGGAR